MIIIYIYSMVLFECVWSCIYVYWLNIVSLHTDLGCGIPSRHVNNFSFLLIHKKRINDCIICIQIHAFILPYYSDAPHPDPHRISSVPYPLAKWVYTQTQIYTQTVLCSSVLTITLPSVHLVHHLLLSQSCPPVLPQKVSNIQSWSLRQYNNRTAQVQCKNKIKTTP